MANAKTASKNNPTTREKAIKHFIGGREIVSVKIVSEKSSFFGAEYGDTGEVVVGIDGTPLPWSRAKQQG